MTLRNAKHHHGPGPDQARGQVPGFAAADGAPHGLAPPSGTGPPVGVGPPAGTGLPAGTGTAQAGSLEHLHQCAALVIDDKPTSRSILSSQLREMGVGTVVQCGRIADARLRLETKPYDIVLCEYAFADSDLTGQDLLDDLRRCNMLPFSTIFVMITGEARYAQVAEAAESALDVYLLKPHNAAALADRISGARRRKISLAPIFNAIEQGDFGGAARLCLERFSTKGKYWLYAARIGAELLLRLEMHDQARMLYEAVIACQTLPWARLGIARAQIEGQDNATAVRTLQALVNDDPGFVDAHDVLGQALFEQGDLVAALDTFRRACDLTPGSITRLQKHGALAFHIGDKAAGVRALEKSVSLGLGSKLFDPQSLVLLAVARFQERDPRALNRCVGDLQRLADKQRDHKRLRRMAAVAAVLQQMLQRQVGEVVSALRTMAAEITADDFDMEAASHLITLVSLVTAEELRLDAAESWIDAMALRHCVNRATTELLACSARAHEPFVQRVRAAHHQLNAMAEEAVSFNLAGDPRSAVLTLLGHGERTLNIKLVDLAQNILDKHRQPIEGATELRQRIERLRHRWAAHHGPARRAVSEGRSRGGMVIRGMASATGARGTSALLPKAEAAPEVAQPTPGGST